VEVQLHHSLPRHYIEMSGVLHAPVALTPGKQPPIAIVLKARCTTEPAWTLRRIQKSLAPAVDRTPMLRSLSLYQLSYPGSLKESVFLLSFQHLCPTLLPFHFVYLPLFLQRVLDILFEEYDRLGYLGQKGQDVKTTTHNHLELRLRICRSSCVCMA
jgi:hypothetical protein